MLLADYHVHTNMSPDCFVSVESMCLSAISAGLREIAITDHYDPCLSDLNCENSYSAERALALVKEMRKKYSSKLSILYGVESGQSQLYEESSRSLLENPFDFVLGSVHNITGDIDLALIDYTSKDIKDAFLCYFKELLAFAKLGLYDVLAHFNYPARYFAEIGGLINLHDYSDLILETIKTIIYNGKGLEVNTKGKRSAIMDFMPNFEIISLYRKMGGEIITIGSDAHKASEVGSNIEDALSLLKDAGFKYITRYEKRIPKFERI